MIIFIMSCISHIYVTILANINDLVQIFDQEKEHADQHVFLKNSVAVMNCDILLQVYVESFHHYLQKYHFDISPQAAH